MDEYTSDSVNEIDRIRDLSLNFYNCETVRAQLIELKLSGPKVKKRQNTETKSDF